MIRKPIAPSIARALAARAGPMSDFTSPPQPAHPRPAPTREWWEGRQDFDRTTWGSLLRPGS